MAEAALYRETGPNGCPHNRAGLYRYTPIEDCARYKDLALHSRKTAANSISLLEKAIEEIPFPIQRIRADRGREFFCLCFSVAPVEMGYQVLSYKAPFSSPQREVERSRRTDLQEFYSTVNLQSEDPPTRLQEWQPYYNRAAL